MRIVFMGTPDFAVPSLQILLDSTHEIAGIVTQPDRPQGRGLKMAMPPVKRLALDYEIPVLQPERLKDRHFLNALQALQADLYVVVAFRILPVSILLIPSKGAVNLHASLLPKYRGAAPIQWAIVNGETETGVTTFFIEQQMDTGEILLQRTLPIGPDETAGELHDRLMEVGAGLIHETVELIATDQAHSIPQQGEPSSAPKLAKSDGLIDWKKPAASIHNQIRGMNPYPMAFTSWDKRTLRVLRSQLCPPMKQTDARPGDIVAVDHSGGIVVQTGRDCLTLMNVQPDGRKRMSAEDFVRGYRMQPGDRLGEINSRA